MSKCCFDPFKIHKKKVIALIYVLSQKCIYSVNPMSRSKTGRRIKVLKSCDTTL